MSDPGPTDESEDVLSSIRRMVSEESGAKPALPEQRGAEPVAAEAADRLVLTPELRIDKAKAGNRKLKSGASLEDSVAELEAALDGASAAGSGEADGKGSPPAAKEMAAGEAAAGEAAASEAAVGEDGWEPAEGVPGQAFAPPGREGAEIEEAEIEVSEGEVSEGEVLEPERPPEPEPKRAGRAISEPPMFSHSRPRSRPRSAATPNVASPDLESLLDEDDLRALVAEVLREELKGPLGERITRNVRKLVRREIAQALSTFDLE